MGCYQTRSSPWRLVFCLFGLSLTGQASWAAPVVAPPEQSVPRILSLESAVAWALQHNPDLAALRGQHAIAEAGIVIAQTYPYNPIFYNRTTYAPGSPPDVTNHGPTQGGLFFPLELCGQGRYRDEAAAALLTRTDWEIAYQEMLLAVRVIRAFQTVIYRQDKLKVAEDTVKLNQQVLEQARKLVELGKLRGIDLIVMRTEVEATRAAVSPARTGVAVALAELYRSLGIRGCVLGLQGDLEGPVVVSDCQALMPRALDLRADLRGRQVAVSEAEARRRLQVADRFGNPTIGPFYEHDQTNVSYYGVQMNLPVPIFNVRRGDVQQREAEIQRAVLDVRRTEVQIHQDVEAPWPGWPAPASPPRFTSPKCCRTCVPPWKAFRNCSSKTNPAPTSCASSIWSASCYRPAPGISTCYGKSVRPRPTLPPRSATRHWPLLIGKRWQSSVGRVFQGDREILEIRSPGKNLVGVVCNGSRKQGYKGTGWCSRSG